MDYPLNRMRQFQADAIIRTALQESIDLLLDMVRPFSPRLTCASGTTINSQTVSGLHVFESAELLPSAWSSTAAGNCYLFNPAITVFRDQIIMIYRVVTPDGQRRLAICRLTPELRVIPESVAPFSDSIQNGGQWRADARFCTVAGRLFAHYNDGWKRDGNHIFLVEIDPDTLKTNAPARRLVMDGPRRAIEKNWMPFEHDGELWAIYSISPHLVLKVEFIDQETALCRPIHHIEWDTKAYSARFGELRGGAPPLRCGDHYVSIFHSSFSVRPLRQALFHLLHKPPAKTLRYVGGVYAFEASPPFTPRWLHPEPIIWPPPLPRRQNQQLDRRIERSAYPCGSAFHRGRWVVSFGSQEEYCCIATMDGELFADVAPESMGN